jgi:hypothetical protein
MPHYCYLNDNYPAFTSGGQAQHETGIQYGIPLSQNARLAEHVPLPALVTACDNCIRFFLIKIPCRDHLYTLTMFRKSGSFPFLDVQKRYGNSLVPQGDFR